MAYYDFVFDKLALRDWCDTSKTSDGPLSMADLLAQSGVEEKQSSLNIPFPSLDELHDACAAIGQSRDVTKGVENGFLAIKDVLRFVLDPLTQPLSWILQFAISTFEVTPWWLMLPIIAIIVFLTSRSLRLVGFVMMSLLFLAFVDHYDHAMQTLAIIFVCAILCVLLGVPIGIAMSRSDRLQRIIIPVLDMLQTLPPFVYLIPLIFLFSITDS